MALSPDILVILNKKNDNNLKIFFESQPSS